MERFEKEGTVLTRDGVAKERGLRTTCNRKLLLFSTDQQFLLDLMFELSTSNSCYSVKVNIENKSNVFTASCQFTNEDSLGDTWAQFSGHPKVWAVIHDEDFISPYRAKCRDYSGIRK